MKYILTIVLLILLLSGTAAYLFWPHTTEYPEDTLAVINGYPLTRSQILEEGGKNFGTQQDILDDAITRQLLINEAQKQGIDRKPAFRANLKHYYEQSLIKNLMESIENKTEAEIGDAEIDTYLNASGRTFFFRTLQITADTAPEEVQQKGEQHRLTFDSISSPIQIALSTMQEGETTVVQQTGSNKIAVFLEKTAENPANVPNLPRKKVKEILHQAKLEAEVNQWIQELRTNAAITYKPSKSSKE